MRFYQSYPILMWASDILDILDREKVLRWADYSFYDADSEFSKQANRDRAVEDMGARPEEVGGFPDPQGPPAPAVAARGLAVTSRMEDLYAKVLGCLGGVMVGDAMGEPFEAPDKLGPKPVPDDPLPSHVTDDWQLTSAVARSIVRRGGFDLLDVALAHVAELESPQPQGRWASRWGRSTVNGVQEIREYLDSRGQTGRSPYSAIPPEPGTGRGNGVAMKASPVVLWACCRLFATDPRPAPDPDRPFFLSEMLDHVMALGAMTHSDRQASVAAYGYSVVLGAVVLGHPSAVLGTPEDRASWLLAQSVVHADLLGGGDDTFGSRMRELLDFDLLFGDLPRLREKVGPGFDAIESVPFSIALFLRNPDDFQAVVMEAIRSGGDADTVAAISGSLAGARNGWASIPEEWRACVPFFEAEAIARSMTEKFARPSRNDSHEQER